MINNNQKYENNNNTKNTLYEDNRNSIILLIKKVNRALDNASQTFFLALYYMDLIFTNENFEKIFKYYYENNENDLKIEINKNDLVMISLCCLIIATKFNENDPNVPNIISFINLCSYYSYNKYIFKVEDLIKAEVIVIKFLEYKLNYFTLYHYFSFFFTHGFLFEKILEKDVIKNMKLNKNEIMEKIYILSREIMDEFIEDFENIEFILGKDIYFTSIEILIWATQHILNISILELSEDKKNIFELLYDINYKKNKEKNEIIKNKITAIYDMKNNKKEKEIKYINNITQINKENRIIIKSNSKFNNENINYGRNNNLLTSCDTYYLEKYKNNNTYLNKNLKNENTNSNIKSNTKNSNIQFYISKYKFINKNNKDVSRSTNNYRYKKLFQFKNNSNIKNINNRYNYSSNKKDNNENKENIDINNNVKILLDKYFKNSINNTNNININNSNNEFDNIIKLNYRYNHNKINNNDFNKPDEIKPVFAKNYLNQNYHQKSINEKNSDMIYKTKLILNKFSYPYSNIKNVTNSENFNQNKQSNFYYSKLFDNKVNNIINDRYSVKENIQDNYSDSKNINIFNNKSIEFFKDKNMFNDNNLSLNLCKINDNKNNNNNRLYKKEENKINNYFPRTYYQYGKINQYENIDKFSNSITKSKYFPYYSMNTNKYCY